MNQIRLASSFKDLKSLNLWQSIIAELLGTFLLAFIGFGSVFSNMNPVKVGLGFGLAGVVIIYCIGPISGGHINPAVSFGLLIARQISLIRFILYIFVQILGATFGYLFISILTKGKVLNPSHFSILSSNNLTKFNSADYKITENIDKIKDLHLKILCELVITFVLVFTVMRLCVEKSRNPTEKGLAPLIIGISITVGVYCGMNISGGSMNPAVSLAKFMCTKQSKGLISHIVGPLLGGFLAAILQQLVFTSNLSILHVKSFLFSHDFDSHDTNSGDSKKMENTNDIQLDKIE